MGGGLLVLHVATTLVVGQIGTFTQERSYVELFEAPRLATTLRNYMSEPGVLLELTRPAFAMNVIGEDSCGALTETEALRQWLFAQAVSVSNRGGSAITMVYVGMDDGRFIGYYVDEGSPPSRYTFRAPGESRSTTNSYGQFADADAVPDSLSALSPTCDLDVDTDGSAVCPIGCADDGDACTGSASTSWTLSTNCPGSSTAEPCTPMNSDGSAGCCDKNIRVYFDTTVENRGVPRNLIEWTTYDPRGRAWYTEEIERLGSTGGWSSIYVFNSNFELGITRTAKLHHTDGSFRGVLGIDFELRELSAIIAAAIDGREDSWAYVVEAGTGLLIATTFSAPLCDPVTFERYTAADVAAPAPTIHESAEVLSDAGWRPTSEGEILSNTVPGRLTDTPKYEATAKKFTHGALDWVIVVGQEIECEPNEIFNVGACQDCPAGQVPLDNRNCLICSEVYPGTVSDEFVGGGVGTRCVCPEGSYSIRDGTTAKCEPCSQLSASVVGVRSEVNNPIAWGSRNVCPGGVNWQTRICPLDSFWVDIHERSASGTEKHTEVNLMTCPACVSALCADSSTLLKRAEHEGVPVSNESSTPFELLSSEEWSKIQPEAVCKVHHTGFLCAECEPGYEAVQGDCVVCDQIDWHWMFIEAMFAVLIGVYLMSTTWHTVCKPERAKEVFDVVDTDHSGFLSSNKVRFLLTHMGNPIAARDTKFVQVLADMKAKNIYHDKSCGMIRTMLPECCGGIGRPAEDVDLKKSLVSPQEFQNWCKRNQPRATVGTYVFALQTFGLITAETTSVSFMEIINMDISAAARTCRIPDCGLFCGLLGMFVVPAFAGLSMYIGIWFLATRIGEDAVTEALKQFLKAKPVVPVGGTETHETPQDSNKWKDAEDALDRLEKVYDIQGIEDIQGTNDIRGRSEKVEELVKEHKGFRGLPLGWHHLQKGFIQLFLFTFAPVTRKCADVLICRTVINAGAEEQRLVSYLQLTCWSGAHLVAAIICSAILVVYTIVIPYTFLKHTRTYVRRWNKVRRGGNPSQSALARPSPSTMEHAEDLPCCSICKPSSFLTPDRRHAHIKADIREDMQRVPALTPKCWDELIKATKPQKYWWFIFILILKLVINVIFLLGQASEYNWQMWMQICLVFAALLSHFTSPYHLKADNRQEQMSFLGLSVVLTITTSGITYSGGWRWYHVCVVVSVVALMTILMIWHQCEAIMTRQKQYEHVRKGLDRMEDDGFVEQVFESVEFRSSGFALLRLNHKTFQKDFSDKDFIKKHFQVEAFRKGQTIYDEGDPARAFYVVMQGEVTLNTVQDRTGRTIKRKGKLNSNMSRMGISFGDEALSSPESKEPPKRDETARATSKSVICLRMVRAEYVEYLGATAKQLFMEIDKDGDEKISIGEIKEALKNLSESEELEQQAGAILQRMDDDHDKKISLDEFKANFSPPRVHGNSAESKPSDGNDLEHRGVKEAIPPPSAVATRSRGCCAAP